MFALVVIVAGLTGVAPDARAAPAVEELTSASGVKGLRATFYVEGTRDVVLNTLWDVHKFKQIFPDIKTLTVKRETKESLDVEFFVDAVLANVSYTLRRTRSDANGTIKWVSIAGDVKSIQGGWTVRATVDPAVSQVIYESYVDVAAIVPTSVVRNAALKKTNEMATRVRAAVKSASAPTAAPSAP